MFPHSVGFRVLQAIMLPSDGAITDLKTFFFRRCWAKFEDIDGNNWEQRQGYFLDLWVKAKACANSPIVHRATLPTRKSIETSANISNAIQCVTVNLGAELRLNKVCSEEGRH